MTHQREKLHGEPARPVEIERFDFSTLVGHKITIFTEQFPGKALESRVTVANGRSISIDRSGGSGLIDNLINDQKIVLQVRYKDEPVAMTATLKRTDGGGCRINLGDKVTPLLRRKWRRVPIACPVRLASIPVGGFTRNGLARLRWLETETINLSGGGAMIRFSSALEPPAHLFVNVNWPDLGFPALIVAQVRHSLVRETGRWNIGLKFIPREQRREHFPFDTIRQMPQPVFAYDHALQANIEEKLIAWMQRHNH